MSPVVLIIDDDEGIRAAFKLVFEFEGYIVRTAANGEEGLRVLENSSPPNVILLDLMMPVMNGWDFIKALEAHPTFHRIPIIIVSASDNSAGAPMGRMYFSKPPEMSKLISAVNFYRDRIS